MFRRCLWPASTDSLSVYQPGPEAETPAPEKRLDTKAPHPPKVDDSLSVKPPEQGAGKPKKRLDAKQEFKAGQKVQFTLPGAVDQVIGEVRYDSHPSDETVSVLVPGEGHPPVDRVVIKTLDPQTTPAGRP